MELSFFFVSLKWGSELSSLEHELILATFRNILVLVLVLEAILVFQRVRVPGSLFGDSVDGGIGSDRS